LVKGVALKGDGDFSIDVGDCGPYTLAKIPVPIAIAEFQRLAFAS
jgi:hypothetical protein